MIVIVCGGREYKDWDHFVWCMDYWHQRLGITKVIQGGQVSLNHAQRHLSWDERDKWGADYFAKRWAELRGIPQIEEAVSQEDWRKLGTKAGPMRNRRMLQRHRPERTIAFPGGAGTADMLEQSRRAGVFCIEVA